MPIDSHPVKRHSPLITLLVFVLMGCAGAARGQTSANVGVLSAYTARGIALDKRPTPQLRVVHDTDNGWYAGGFGSTVELDERNQAQLIAYGGHARKITSTVTLDAGISRSMFTRSTHASYTEFHAGVAVGRVGARLFYAPAYYGEGHTLYLDLSSSHPLGDNLTLVLHGGLLHPFGAYDAAARNATDVRVSLVTEVRGVRLQGGWQANWHPYMTGAGSTPAFTAGASIAF